MSIIPKASTATATSLQLVDNDDSSSIESATVTTMATAAAAAVAVNGTDKSDLYVAAVNECDPLRDDQQSTQPQNVDVKICCTLEMKFIWYAPCTFVPHYFPNSVCFFFWSQLRINSMAIIHRINECKIIKFIAWIPLRRSHRETKET